MKKKSLLLFSAIFLFMGGCAQKEKSFAVKFKTLVPITLKEYDANPFSMSSGAKPVLSVTADKKYTLEGFVVFPKGSRFAKGKIFYIQDDNNTSRTGLWTIRECETNATKIRGILFNKRDASGYRERFIKIPQGKCLKIFLKGEP